MNMGLGFFFPDLGTALQQFPNKQTDLNHLLRTGFQNCKAISHSMETWPGKLSGLWGQAGKLCWEPGEEGAKGRQQLQISMMGRTSVIPGRTIAQSRYFWNLILSWIEDIWFFRNSTGHVVNGSYSIAGKKTPVSIAKYKYFHENTSRWMTFNSHILIQNVGNISCKTWNWIGLLLSQQMLSHLFS